MQSMHCRTGPCLPYSNLPPRQSRHPLDAVGYSPGTHSPLRTTPQDRRGGTEVVTGVSKARQWPPGSTPQGSSAKSSHRNTFLGWAEQVCRAGQARARAKGRQKCRDGEVRPQKAPKHRLQVLARSADLFAWAPRTAWMPQNRSSGKGFLGPTNYTGAPQSSLQRDPVEERNAFETPAGSQS